MTNNDNIEIVDEEQEEVTPSEVTSSKPSPE
jgi:uncharacterized protein YnzC (UPF0291/DUF896 family)